MALLDANIRMKLSATKVADIDGTMDETTAQIATSSMPFDMICAQSDSTNGSGY